MRLRRRRIAPQARPIRYAGNARRGELDAQGQQFILHRLRELRLETALERRLSKVPNRLSMFLSGMRNIVPMAANIFSSRGSISPRRLRRRHHPPPCHACPARHPMPPHGSRTGTRRDSPLPNSYSAQGAKRCVRRSSRDRRRSRGAAIRPHRRAATPKPAEGTDGGRAACRRQNRPSSTCALSGVANPSRMRIPKHRGQPV